MVLQTLDPSVFSFPNRYGLLPIGVSRVLDVDASARGTWDILPGGRYVWRVALQTPGASAVRLHFSRFHVGAGQVWVYPASEASAVVEGPFTGSGPFHNGEFWTPSVPSDHVIVEYLPAEGASESSLPPFRIDQIGHLWQTPLAALPDPSIGDSPAARFAHQLFVVGAVPPAAAAPCHLDYKCFPEWADQGMAVARIDFRGDDGQFYLCSGTLLNTRNRSLIPYFLTAAHCISSEAEARSVQAYFLYDSFSCNGSPAQLESAARVAGARLLVTRPPETGDFTLLELSSLPNRPVVLSGWDANDLGWSRSLTVIHHPAGSYKRIAFGNRAPDWEGWVSGTYRPADMYYRVRYTSGRTEGGSSGSPLFYKDNISGYLVGALSFGMAPRPGFTVCDISPFEDSFGRFSVMFRYLAPFLSVAPPPLPTISAAPGRLDFVVRGLATEPEQHKLRVETTSSNLVNFSVSATQPWIRVSPVSGSVSASGPAEVTVTIDPSPFPAAGSYSGTINLKADGVNPPSIAIPVSVSVRGPRIGPESFRNAASLAPGIVPGAVITVIGAGLAQGIRGCATPGGPVGLLPLQLAGVEVLFGQHPAPLFAVCNVEGTEFVRLQAPFELGVGTVDIVVKAGGEAVFVPRVPVLPAQPGIFETWIDGRPYAVVLQQDGSFVTPANPLRCGTRGTVFVTGLGPVVPFARTNQPGVPGQSAYLPVVVGVNNAGVSVVAADYAPNLIGIFAVTFEVPETTPVGENIPFAVAVRLPESGALVFGNGSRIAVGP